jgi:hypothetical protein
MTNSSARSPWGNLSALQRSSVKSGDTGGDAPTMEVVEPLCRICRDPGLRRLVNQLLDWRGVPIPEGGKTYRITSYRTILAWINKQRPDADPISYDSLWVHAKRHYEFAGIVAYWSARMDKEWRDALEALRSTGNQVDSTPSLPESSLDSRSQSSE